MTRTASVIGASGFTGGELLRLIDGHPEFELEQATSRSFTNKTVGAVHPNLRHVDCRFTDPADLESVDVLFAGVPHGVTMERIDAFREASDVLVDLSADFRLEDEAQYDRWYDGHSRPELLGAATYALPELDPDRSRVSQADFLACGGCNATVTILGLRPLVAAGLVGEGDVVVDVKVGSSEGGSEGGPASHHAERSGIVRPYAPTGHRHEAEIETHLGRGVSFTAHAVDMIRGAAATCHVFPEQAVTKADLWQAYRSAYEDEPFVRLVAGGGGVYRYPEPKAVAGSNFAEVGFELDERNGRIVVFAAIDNMMKGSAGQAIHAANLACGYEETAGLELTGFHPVGAP